MEDALLAYAEFLKRFAATVIELKERCVVGEQAVTDQLVATFNDGSKLMIKVVAPIQPDYDVLPEMIQTLDLETGELTVQEDSTNPQIKAAMGTGAGLIFDNVSSLLEKDHAAYRLALHSPAQWDEE